MSDYDNLNDKGEINELLGSLKATASYSKDESDDKIKNMRDLLVKAYTTIEAQQAKIRELQADKIPSKDEVESLSAMLDVLNKLDIKTIDKLSSLDKKRLE